MKEEDISEQNISVRKYRLTGEIASLLVRKMDDNLKYDEPARIILSFCGYYHLRESKRVILGEE